MKFSLHLGFNLQVLTISRNGCDREPAPIQFVRKGTIFSLKASVDFNVIPSFGMAYVLY